MKTLRTLIVTLLLLSPYARALLPQPQVTYYGQAVDEYGWPIQNNAVVILNVNGIERARQTINGSVAPGINFALPLLLDNGTYNTNYVPNAVTSGAPVTLTLFVNGQQRLLFGVGAIPAIPAPGTLIYVGLSSGTDTDGDGLPDEWEWDLIWNSGGVLNTLADVTPGGDFDGDGYSNRDEFLCGTVAYWDFDYLKLTLILIQPNTDRPEVGFVSVPGKAYQLTTATNSTLTGWQPATYFSSSGNTLTTSPFGGLGGLQKILINTNEPRLNLRLELR